MGFGTLFIGYFLMLNITYFTFTDIVSALVMMLGLYKLSSVSPGFKRPMYAAGGFAVFALAELVFGIITLFSPAALSAATAYIGMVRSFMLAIFTVLLLMSCQEICEKLEVRSIPVRCRTLRALAIVIYGANILLQTPMLTSFLPVLVSAFLYLAVIIGTIILIIMNLTVIYGCYMNICMPEDLVPKPEKPSRFAFINEYRRRQEEKRAEEAEAAKRRYEEKMRRKKKK